MKCLALDTSSNCCSVALMQSGGSTILQSRDAPRLHAQLILPMIDDVLQEAELSLSELDALAFSAGPGSFTGIRIAAGVVQGLGYGADLPIVAVSTLAAMAQAAYRLHKAVYSLPLIDARMNQVYVGCYAIDDHHHVARALQPDFISKPETILSSGLDITTLKAKSYFGVGSGFDTYPTVLSKILQPYLQSIDPQLISDAQDVAVLAMDQFLKGEYTDAEHALPVYLRSF